MREVIARSFTRIAVLPYPCLALPVSNSRSVGLAHALDHRVVVERVRQDHAVRDKLGSVEIPVSLEM
jgi:hypothetical protein